MGGGGAETPLRLLLPGPWRPFALSWASAPFRAGFGGGLIGLKALKGSALA